MQKITNKICSSCKKEKSTDSFYKKTGSNSEFVARCKECKTKDNRSSYNHEWFKRWKQEQFEKYPLKQKAHSMIRTEVRAGRMERESCSVCGEKKAQAHHDDYEKPLEVIWLCRTHHKERHRIVNIIRR